MDERLKDFSRKAAGFAVDPTGGSPAFGQRHIDRYQEIQASLMERSLFVTLRDGWVVMVDCSGIAPDQRCTCSLVSPDGDGYWSSDGVAMTSEGHRALATLAVLARSQGFRPPSDVELEGAIPGNWIEACLTMLREKFLRA